MFNTLYSLDVWILYFFAFSNIIFMSPATSLTVPYSPFYKNYGLNKNNL